jgi:hypothetical protein
MIERLRSSLASLRAVDPSAAAMADATKERVALFDTVQTNARSLRAQLDSSK